MGFFRVLRPKISRDVHDLKHQKLQGENCGVTVYKPYFVKESIHEKGREEKNTKNSVHVVCVWSLMEINANFCQMSRHHTTGHPLLEKYKTYTPYICLTGSHVYNSECIQMLTTLFLEIQICEPLRRLDVNCKIS